MDKWLQIFFDVTARKPSGPLGRLMYRKPVEHYGFFHVVIENLQLRPEDVFLEVGCGGGVLLEMVLQTVQRACGIDHSPDMVELARQKNAQALSEGRVELVQGKVETLPWGGNHENGRRRPQPVAGDESAKVAKLRSTSGRWATSSGQ